MWYPVFIVATHRTKTFGRLSDGRVFFLGVSRYIPLRVLEGFYNHMPGLGLDLVKRNRALAHEFAREIIADKVDDAAHGKRRHDIMSILGKFSLTVPWT